MEKSRWDRLTMRQRSELMSGYIRNGIRDLGVMKAHYNGIGESYAEGGKISQDYDPGHPYHYHNAEGKKVVIDPDVWEKYKDKEWFAEYRKAVEDEMAKHPGPEYGISQTFMNSLKKAVNDARRDWNKGGFDNWRNYGSAMPEGYSIDENGIVYDKSGNAYVQPQFNDSRFAYGSGEPVKVVYNEGKPIEQTVSYYPIEMQMEEKKPLPVDKYLSFKEIEEAKAKAEEDYVTKHSLYYTPWLGSGIYDPGKDRVVTFDEYRRSYPFKGDTIYDSKSHTALYGDTNNRPFLTYDQFVRGLSKVMDSVGWNNSDNRDYLMESYINNFPDEYKNRRSPSKSKVKQNVKAPLYGEGGDLHPLYKGAKRVKRNENDARYMHMTFDYVNGPWSIGPDGRNHYPDWGKRWNHPTYSTESLYKVPGKEPGRWEEGYRNFELSDWQMENPNNTIFGLYGNGDGGVVPTHKGSVVMPEITVTPKGNYFYDSYEGNKIEFGNGGELDGDKINKRPSYKKSNEAYYDPNKDIIYAPDSTNEFYDHEYFHARPDTAMLNRLKPYYSNLNDSVLTSYGADMNFVKRTGDLNNFYQPEEIGARLYAAKRALNKAGINKIDRTFLTNLRENESLYGDNMRDLLHMYNDDILIRFFNEFKNGGHLYGNGGKELKKNIDKYIESGKTFDEVLNENKSLAKLITPEKIEMARRWYDNQREERTNLNNNYQYQGYPFKDRQDFIENSYNNWLQTFIKNGHSSQNADSLAGYATIQDALESQWGESPAASHNNFGGMRVNGKNLKYKTPEEYYDDKYNMFATRFPQVFEALSDTAYVDSLNSGEYQYAPHDENPTYKQDFLNMKTAKRYLNNIRKK